MKWSRTRIFQFVPRARFRKSVMRLAVDLTDESDDSGFPGPAPGPKCDGILLWEPQNGARVTLAGGILAGQKEWVSERARRQNGTPRRSQRSSCSVVSTGLHAECTRRGCTGRVPGPGLHQEQYPGWCTPECAAGCPRWIGWIPGLRESQESAESAESGKTAILAIPSPSRPSDRGTRNAALRHWKRDKAARKVA